MTTRSLHYVGLIFATVACGGAVDSAANPSPTGDASAGSGGTSSTPIPRDTPIDGLIVHEWGTYTSVHATDGHALGGVHHVDEPLPAWVHRREFTPQSYNVEVLPEEPKQQLETPVLYFHSPKVQQVVVDVGFPDGIVGEWFPDAVSFSPPILQLEELGGGAMSWDVTLDPGIHPDTFLGVDPQEIWAPSRKVDSTPVLAISPAGIEEREQFIFYRGLGKFEPKVVTSVAADGTITLSNGSDLTLARVFLLRASKSAGTFVDLGSLGPDGSISTPTPKLEDSVEVFLDAARTGLAKALVESGLYPDEAQAMVETWTRSWFQNEGIRLLYLAPREWADAWLPMQIRPEPAELVRTLVGRVELLTVADEQSLVTDLEAAAAGDGQFSLDSLGRFAEPRLTRAIEQLDGSARDLAQQLRNQVHSQP